MAKLDPNSLTDFLSSSGKDASLTSRAGLAVSNGLVKTADEYITLAGKGQNADINTKLLGILRGASVKDTGGTTTAPVISSPTGVSNPADAHNFINGNQQNDFNTATKKTGDEPPIRTSTQTYQDMFNNLKATITPTTEKPNTPNFVDLYNTNRTKYGVTDLESSLNDAKARRQALLDANDARKRNEEGKPVAMNVIQGRQSEEDRQAQIELNNINREIEDTSNELTQKYNVINSIMDFSKLDYTNATDRYDKDFTQSLNLFNTVKGIADSEKSANERAQDNARANLQIIYNGMSAGGVNFETLTPDQKTNITKLETEAGLPIGFYTSIQNKNPKGDILSTTTRDTGGKKYADVIIKNADGSLSTKSIYLGGVDKGSNDMSQGETLISARSIVAPQLQAKRGEDGYVSPESFNKARDAWVNTGLSAEDFNKSFKQYANPESYEKLGLTF